MAKPHLQIGNIVKVTGYRPGKYAPGIRDEMGTEKLFQSLVGSRHKIHGFDAYGNVELRPKRLTFVWI